jgi:hypothetical protein
MRHPFLRVEWSGNGPHALRHGCTKDGVEDILRQRCHPARIVEHQLVRGERRVQINGKTCRVDEFYGLAVVPMPGHLVRPIACWNLAAEPATLRRYKAWLQAVEARRARR